MMRQSQHQQPQNYHQQQDYQSKLLYELSSLVMNIMRSPPASLDLIGDGSTMTTASASNLHRLRRTGPSSFQQITPAGFASLLLGVSLTLMLCGSVTFFIGFLLMPWVLGLVVFLYFVGIVSSISMIGKAVFCYGSAAPSPSKDVPSWKLL